MLQAFPGGSVVKNPPANAGDRFDLWVGKIPWRRVWQPTPVFLLGKSHGQRSLEGYSPWDRKGSETTEPLRMHAKSDYGDGCTNLYIVVKLYT